MVETRMDAMISRLTTQTPSPTQRPVGGQAIKARLAVKDDAGEVAAAKIFARRAFQVGDIAKSQPTSRGDEPRGGNLDILA